jgi:hypothetical protein
LNDEIRLCGGTMRQAIVLVVVLSLLPAAIVAEGPVPRGDQFEVNTYTTDSQYWTDLAVAPNGDFIVVWNKRATAVDDWNVRGRRYASDGNAYGSEFQVNSYDTGRQRYPSVAVNAIGDFVVAYRGSTTSGGDTFYGIQARRFAADGTPQGDDIQVNTYMTDVQGFPDVGVADDGSFIVVWQSFGSTGSDDDGKSIQMRRFDTDGNPLGDDIQVNTYITSGQGRPQVTVRPSGEFLVVWHSNGSFGSDADESSVQLRRFDSNGNPLGDDLQVNTYTTSSQGSADATYRPDGSFVVIWNSYGSSSGDTSQYSVQGQRFRASGTPWGSQFQANTYSTGSQKHADVAPDPRGGFVVTWMSDGSWGSDQDQESTQVRLFREDATPMGAEYQVNTYTTAWQNLPALATDSAGDFVVVFQSWGSPGLDTDRASIHARRFGHAIIFADGFESGDTSVWSNAVP